MSKAEHTKTALQAAACKLFWTRGYSNVSLREIAAEAGADVALVSRYFGSKRGLFDATLVALPVLDTDAVQDAGGLVAYVVALFAETPRNTETPSPTALILMNAGDAEVGDAVREAYRSCWHEPIARILGSECRAALFSAAMLGMSVAEKNLHLDGIAPSTSLEYKKQLKGLLTAAISPGTM